MGLEEQMPYIDLTVNCTTCGKTLLKIEGARLPPDGYETTCPTCETTYEVKDGVASMKA